MRNSNLIFSAAVAVSAILGISAASAADLAPRAYTKAPPMVDPAYNWTGFYIGADAGGAWSRQSANSVSPVAINQAPTAGSLNSDGVVGGLYAGYNWAVTPVLVFGLEGDFSGIKSSASYSAPNLLLNGTPAGPAPLSAARDLNWLATARGRAGYSVTPNALFFVTAGAAWAGINYFGVDNFGLGCPTCATFSSRETRTGYAVGGGVDWAPWSNNWVVRAEYLYYHFGGDAFNAFTGGTLSTTFYLGDLDIHTARIGLSYKFGGPVVAKY
jgi:outer membrane immunogenic protein